MSPFAQLQPHLPAVLLLLFSGWSGTFAGGAEGSSAVAGHLALLIFVAAFGRVGPNSLGLGRSGHWLLAAFAATLAASWLASPVARAGRLGLVLLPAFLLVPSAVARCWSTAERRRLGIASLSLVVAGVAGWSLLAWWRFETPGTSLPLGHHNLLAAWLLALLPLAALPWREGGIGRAIAGLAAAAAVASLAATRSLGALTALAVIAVAVALWRRKGWVVLVVALLLAPEIPRLSRILAGADTSVTARWGYLEAGWRGWQERPVVGWGPGAASWTTAEHLRPIPGVHPPDQVVADLHSLPLQLGYELGWSGLLLAVGLALVFLRRRGAAAEDPQLRRFALLGLAALAVMSCTGLPLAVAALPLAAAVGVGAVFAAEGPRASSGRAPAVIAAVAMAALVLPLDLAHLAYDRAIDAENDGDQLRHLRRAAELDPGFPLYRARLAWLEDQLRPGEGEVARRARAAAEDARGLAPLWLVAGAMGQEAGEPWSREALLEACRLSPLGAIAPFRLTLGNDPEAVKEPWAARALLAEPLLMAAVDWRDRGPLLAAAVGEIGRLAGVPAAWRLAIEEIHPTRAVPGGPTRRLVLEMDGDAATSASLHAFRRRPWSVYLATVEVFAEAAGEVDQEAAARIWTTDPSVFGAGRCGLGDL